MTENKPDTPVVPNDSADLEASTTSLVLLAIYVSTYLVASLWLFVEGWLNQFNALHPLWGYPADQVFPPMLQAAMFSLTGASIYDVQRAMGHASIQTTEQLYGHLVPGYHDDLRKRQSMITEGVRIDSKPILRVVNS